MLFRKAVFAFLILSASAGILISGYWMFADWAELDKAWWEYRRLAKNGVGLRELFIAQSSVLDHRINCFADGVGVCLGAVIWSLGFLGLYQAKDAEAKQRNSASKLPQLSEAKTATY